MENKLQISQEQIDTIIQWAHDYGKSEQFNIGLFGTETNHHKPFTLEQAKAYIKTEITSKLSTPL